MRGVVYKYVYAMEGGEGMNVGVISGEGERKTEQSGAESSRAENKVLEPKSSSYYKDIFSHCLAFNNEEHLQCHIRS